MAKMILDYIKVLVWPVIVLLAILSFRGELGDLAKRTESFKAGILSAEFSDTSTGGNEIAMDNPSPEMWFDLQNINMSHAQCLSEGEKALRSNGFGQGGINNGNTAYGYDDNFVGAVWCIQGLDFALLAVAGPDSNIASQKAAGIKKIFKGRP